MLWWTTMLGLGGGAIPPEVAGWYCGTEELVEAQGRKRTRTSATHVRVDDGRFTAVYALVGTNERYAGVLEHAAAGAQPLTVRADFRNTALQHGTVEVSFAADFQSYRFGWSGTDVYGRGEGGPRRVSGPKDPRCGDAGALVLAVESGQLVVP